MRQCSKPGCTRGSVATLTYDYKDSTAVLGPLSTSLEPHTYDLCEVHAGSLTVPRGWQVIRLQTQFDPAPPSTDDLLALVDAIRDAAGQTDGEDDSGQEPSPSRRDSRPEYGSFTKAKPEEDRSAKYAPLRRWEHLTVISGDEDDS